MNRMLAPLLAVSLIASALAAAIAQAPETGLERLTVPASALPAGCRLMPPRQPSRVGETGRPPGTVTITAAPLPLLPSNPWTGTDRRIVAMLRRSVEPPAEPDGPPLSGRQAAQYLLHSADGVSAAYRAVYLAPDDSAVTVYGLRFETEALAAATHPPRWSGAVHRVVRGADVIVVHAPGENACFEAVRDHAAPRRPAPGDVESLVKQALDDRIAARQMPDSSLLKPDTTIAVREEMPRAEMTLGSASLPQLESYQFRLISGATAQAEADNAHRDRYLVTVDSPSIDGDTATVWLGIDLLLPRESTLIKLCCCTGYGQFRRSGTRWAFVKWLQMVCA